jgi:hypothetical protein
VKDLKARISTLQGWWTTTGTVYVEPTDRKSGDNLYLRERLTSEYPENQRLYWAGTIKAIDALQIQVDALREHCLTELHLTPED